MTGMSITATNWRTKAGQRGLRGSLSSCACSYAATLKTPGERRHTPQINPRYCDSLCTCSSKARINETYKTGAARNSGRSHGYKTNNDPPYRKPYNLQRMRGFSRDN